MFFKDSYTSYYASSLKFIRVAQYQNDNFRNNDTSFIKQQGSTVDIIESEGSSHVENRVASISTRTTQVVEAVPNQMTTGYGIPEDYKMDMKPFLKRPFYLGRILWEEGDYKYKLLKTPVTHLPGDVLISNTSLRNAVRVGAMMKPSLELHISLNGTLTHAGCLLFGVLPPGVIVQNQSADENVYLVNTILSGPHVKLFANEATSAVLQVPWYCNTDMCETTILDGFTTASVAEKGNLPMAMSLIPEARDGGMCSFGTLVCMVLNPLRPGAAVTSLTVTMEAIFTEFELAVPTPRFIADDEWVAQSGDSEDKPLWKRALTGLLDIGSVGAKTLYPIFGDAIDYARNTVRNLTGLHNFNVPIIETRVLHTSHNYRNTTDIPQFFEKLDPHSQYNRLCQEPIFGTSYDEMNISYITSKPQYIGSFDVKVDDPAGKVLWSRPISPFQGGGIGSQPYFVPNVAESQTRLAANNLELMHALHRYWRGDLAVTLEVVMNNKTHLKLKVIKYYSPARNVLEDKLPTMASLSNAPSQLLEFSAGAQRYCVDLPYLCKNELMPCAENQTVEGMMHGVYLIYLAQPMVIGDSSPNNVTVNVYIRGVNKNPDTALRFYGYMHKDVMLDRVVNGGESYFMLPDPQGLNGRSAWEPQSGGSQSCMPSCTVPMNEPQEQNDSFKYDTLNGTVAHYNRLLPNVDLRPLLRRMYKVYDQYVKLDQERTDSINIPLASLLAETNQRSLAPSVNNQYRNLALITSMFHGKSCVGFKMRIDYRATHPADIKVYYIPPGVASYSPSDYSVLTMAQPNTDVFDPPIENLNSYKPQLLMASNDMCVDAAKGSFEFLIPDVTAFKFVGGPNKYRPTSLSIASPFEDMGTLHIQMKSEILPPQQSNRMQVEVFSGLTDESRLGFHTIAPVFALTTGKFATYTTALYGQTEEQILPKFRLPLCLYLGHPHAGDP